MEQAERRIDMSISVENQLLGFTTSHDCFSFDFRNLKGGLQKGMDNKVSGAEAKNSMPIYDSSLSLVSCIVLE